MPQIFHGPVGSSNFTPHIALLIPFFIILIGLGISQLAKEFMNKTYQKLFVGIIGLLYLLAFLNFSYFYFLKFPLQEATFEAQNRFLSRYISLYKNDTPITIHSTNPKLTYREFIFYTDAYNKNTADEINTSLRNNKFTIKNISFVGCDNEKIEGSKKLVIDDFSCARSKNIKFLKIVQLRDNGVRYYIYNDSICRKYNLSPYIPNLKLTDLNVEKLHPSKFCEKYIISQ